jgi:hypothetical protein
MVIYVPRPIIAISVRDQRDRAVETSNVNNKREKCGQRGVARSVVAPMSRDAPLINQLWSLAS